jgi:Glyoxalase-like domain
LEDGIMRLDHVVVLVDDLAQGIEQYTARGFTVTPGGEHTYGNTHNALISLADDVYLELIAFKVAYTTPHRWDRYRAFPGVIDYCLRVDSLGEAVHAINARGLEYEAGGETGRLRPDGAELRWRTGSLASQERGLPFLIEDITPRSLRVPGGAAMHHANGVLGVAQLDVLVPDLEQAGRDFTSLLGSNGSEEGASLKIKLDGVTFSVGTPAPISTEGRLLTARGAGPWRLNLRREVGEGIVL